MNTNHHGHALRNLTNRVVAVIDDAQNTQTAVETLERAGIAEQELTTLAGVEGAREIDAAGIRSGSVTHVLRALQSITVEGSHLRRYEAELASGHHVVDVRAHGREKRDAVVRILRSCGAHFINTYGPWTIETVAA